MVPSISFPLQVFLFYGAAVHKQTKCVRAGDKGARRSLAGSVAWIMHCYVWFHRVGYFTR